MQYDSGPLERDRVSDTRNVETESGKQQASFYVLLKNNGATAFAILDIFFTFSLPRFSRVVFFAIVRVILTYPLTGSWQMFCIHIRDHILRLRSAHEMGNRDTKTSVGCSGSARVHREDVYLHLDLEFLT